MPEPELEEDPPTEEDAPPAEMTQPRPTPLRHSPPSGLYLGEGRDGEPVVVPTAALNTHVAVVGAAGSGKTWMAKVLAEEAVRNGIPVIAIDPQGDLVQFLQRRDEREVPPALLPMYRELAERVEPRIFTPGSSHGTRLALDPIRLPHRDDLAAIEGEARRAEEEDNMIQAVAVNLASLASASGDRSSQETFLLQVLRGMKRREAVDLADVVHHVRDPELSGIDDPTVFIKDSARTNLAMKLTSLVHGTAANLFSGGVPLDIDAMLRPSAEGRVPLNVIYLNAMTNDDQKQFFVASLASEIYRWMVTSASAEGGRTSFLFYLDEARDYLPAGAKRPMAKEPLLRLFSQGRKYGVGCLICTQSPRSVDYNAFGNCSSKVIGRLESAQDVERVSEWFSTEGGAPSWLKGRKGADAGSFVARWAGDGDHKKGRSLRGRLLYSAHEGAWSPDRVEREVREAGGG
ncbi:MAG: ATP-binding protein [Myxococcota bacterium]